MSTSTKQRRLAQRAALTFVVASALALSACGSGGKSTDTSIAGTTAAATSAAAQTSVETSAVAETSAAVAGTSAAAAETFAGTAETSAATAETSAASADPAADTTATKPTDTKTTDPKAAAAAAVAASNANVDANAIPKLKGEVGALADVTVKDCVKDGADWTAKGTLTNSSKAAAAYVITTSFLDDKGTTLGLGWSKIDSVNAGDSQDWSVKAPATGDKLQCIMRVTRGAA